MEKKDDSLDRRRFLRYIGAGSGVVATGCLSQSAPSDGSEDGETTSGGQQGSVEEGSQPSQKVSKRFLPEVSWSFDTDGQVYGSPAVVDGVAYIGSHDGRMYAFTEEGTDISVNNDYPMFNYDLQNTSAPDTEGPTGEVVQAWSYPTQGVVTTAPAVVDGKVYFGSEDNYFYCLSADDGSEIWKFDAGGMISGGSPTVRDGVVYFPSGYKGDGVMGVPQGESNGRMNALDSETGEVVWRNETDAGLQNPPAVTEDMVYHGSREKRIFAVDRGTGDKVWDFEAEDVFCACKPAVYDGMVYIGSEDKYMYAVGAEDGDLIWKFETDHILVSSPVVTEESVYFGSYDKKFYRLDRSTGEKIWEYDATGPVLSSPAYSNGLLYFGTQNGWVHAVDGESGKKVWSIEQSADRHYPVISSPVVTEDMVYFGTKGNSVYGVRNRSVSADEYESNEPTVTLRNG